MDQTRALILYFCIAMVTARSIREMTIFDIAESTETLEKQPDNVDHWFGSTKVAFTAYLSNNKEQLGKGQHVKFDKVILNDGSAYKPNLGIFTAPVNGVYTFTVVIAQRHRNEIRVRLVVDGENEVDAIAEGMHTGMDVQGTNTMNIFLCKGKSVYVETVNPGRMEGDTGDNRYSSFSGHLLYIRN